MGDLGLTPGLGRFSGEGKGYPLQDSGLENSRGPKELDATFTFTSSITKVNTYKQRQNTLTKNEVGKKSFVVS